MAEDGTSSLMKRPLWVIIWVLLIEAVIVLVLIPGNWMDTVIDRESKLIEGRMGQSESEWIKSRAHDIYKRNLIDNGFYKAAHDHLIPPSERKQAKGWENFGAGYFTWIDGRMRALAKIFYHFSQRFVVMRMWLPFLLILLIPAIIDGICSWKVKREGFAYSSSILHRWSYAATGWVVVIQIAVFLMPYPIDPLVMPFQGVFMCIFIGIFLGNMQKRF
ncbi:MAG: DUF4400 domain-containing protein [Gammaproteobacteria bacterium]|nr:MAG: DUF4400 domain-containing protein [Gammaproteobacteria bacterium]